MKHDNWWPLEDGQARCPGEDPVVSPPVPSELGAVQGEAQATTSF